MTFSSMFWRIFKANLRRYLLYFLCSSFTIMFFFTFTSLNDNPDFQDFYKVNGMISGNLYAPLLILKVFSVFFILYAQSAFAKQRKRDYGLFMVLGMTPGNIRLLILFENSLIALGSIAAGLGAGTLFAGLFYLIVSQLVDLGQVSFSLRGESYLNTALYFLIIYAIVIAGSLLVSLRYNIVTLLKEARSADRMLLRGKLPGFFGLALIAYAVVDVNIHNPYENTVFFRTLGCCVAGVYLLLCSLGDWMEYSLSRFASRRQRHLLFSSDVKHTLGQSRLVLFMITTLAMVSLLLSSMTFFIDASSGDVARMHNPYDIAYTKVMDKNELPADAVQAIVESGPTPLQVHKELEYVDDFTMKFFLDHEINKLTGSSYQVKPGHFLNLSLYDMNDGYDYAIPEMADYTLKLAAGNRSLQSQGTVVEMLFNRLPPVINGLQVILDEADYNAIKAEMPRRIGHIQLFSFEDWKQTGTINDKLNDALDQYNQEHSKQWYDDQRQDRFVFGTQSRIVEHQDLEDGGQFAVLVMLTVSLLFLGASSAVLHFSILTRREQERLKFRKLHRLGITSAEAEGVVRGPLILLFFVPAAAGIALAVFFGERLGVPMSTGGGLQPIAIPVAVSFVYLCLQFLFYRLYAGRYARSLLAEVGIGS
ncbi:FtsX-like permease family protein [Paenibacillus donghaensis]|nr:ABC transporter permease [Paenibacillus donghaensis]